MKIYIHTIDENRHRDFLNEKRKDVFSKQELKAGDQIVFCAGCKCAFLVASWEAMENRHRQCNTEETLAQFPVSKIEFGKTSKFKIGNYPKHNFAVVNNQLRNLLKLLQRLSIPLLLLFLSYLLIKQMSPVISRAFLEIQLKQGWTKDAIAKDLKKAQFVKKNLRGVKFNRANLEQANFQNADLSLADFEGANLTQANLKGAILRGANLRNTNIKSTTLDQEDLLMWQIINQPRANRQLHKFNLSYFFLGNALLTNANLREAKMEFVVLTNANLKGARMARVQLTGANLRAANLSNVNLSYAELEQVIASLTNMNNTNLYGSNLRWVDFTGAKLENADFRWTDLKGANFKEANLKNAKFYGSNRNQAKTDQLTICPTGKRGPCW